VGADHTGDDRTGVDPNANIGGVAVNRRQRLEIGLDVQRQPGEGGGVVVAGKGTPAATM
jgi:hypothetical protein